MEKKNNKKNSSQCLTNKRIKMEIYRLKLYGAFFNCLQFDLIKNTNREKKNIVSYGNISSSMNQNFHLFFSCSLQKQKYTTKTAALSVNFVI